VAQAWGRFARASNHNGTLACKTASPAPLTPVCAQGEVEADLYPIAILIDELKVCCGDTPTLGRQLGLTR